MTTIFNLPRDFLEEVFFRIPSRSMREVRLTCRMWDTLLRSQSFAKMHIEKTASAAKEGESQMIMVMDYNLYLKSVVFDNDPSIEPKGKLTCLNEQVKILKVFNCEGLLLCILKDDTKVVVWDPCWGQTRWIKLRYSNRAQDYMDWHRYALGYVNKKERSCRSHKILRFIDDHLFPDEPLNLLWYEIYDFDSDLWTTLNVSPHWRISYYEHGVTLKGNTYWCATKSKSGLSLDKHIICFDFKRERFGPLLTLPFSHGIHDYVNISCVREEKLAVSLQRRVYGYINEIEIWITTKIEAENMSWSKFLTMDTRPNFVEIWITTKIISSFLIDEEKKVAMFTYKIRKLNNSTSLIVYLIGEDGYSRRLDLEECAVKGCTPSVCSYVPSLVQIKQSEGF